MKTFYFDLAYDNALIEFYSVAAPSISEALRLVSAYQKGMRRLGASCEILSVNVVPGRGKKYEVLV